VSGVEEGSPRRIDGVLFDYGETLVEFSRPVAALSEAEARMLAVLAEAGHGHVSSESLLAVLDRVDREVIDYQRTDASEEMDLPAVALRAYHEAGLHLDERVLDELLRIEQEAWWQGARVDPDAVPLLDFLRDRGVRTGICSNAPYRARSLHEQIAFLGLDTHLDAVTFSAEVGWRKPSTRMFDAALRALGTERPPTSPARMPGGCAACCSTNTLSAVRTARMQRSRHFEICRVRCGTWAYTWDKRGVQGVRQRTVRREGNFLAPACSSVRSESDLLLSERQQEQGQSTAVGVASRCAASGGSVHGTDDSRGLRS
jgi:FMN phosphatase YigB (HAD superfamily)